MKIATKILSIIDIIASPRFLILVSTLLVVNYGLDRNPFLSVPLVQRGVRPLLDRFLPPLSLAPEQMGRSRVVASTALVVRRHPLIACFQPKESKLSESEEPND
jgi:hypothetical protein